MSGVTAKMLQLKKSVICSVCNKMIMDKYVIYDSADGKFYHLKCFQSTRKNPTLVIPIRSRKQLKHLFEAQDHLGKAGVTFDSGSQIKDGKEVTRDWELDWSLKGATLKNPIRHTSQGWFWGSRGPFATREKAVQVAQAVYAGGWKGKSPERRYPTAADKIELIDLYHLARVPGKVSRYDRMSWSVNQFVKKHPEWTSASAYKAMDEALYHSPISNPTIEVEPYTPSHPAPGHGPEHMIKLMDNGREIGFLGYEVKPDRIKVHYIRVADEYRGKRYSDILVKRLVEIAKGKPIDMGQLNYNSDKMVKRLREAGVLSRSNPSGKGLYESFHGNPPKGARMVEYNAPKSPLVKIGRLTELKYTPEFPSKHVGTEFYHVSGDTGQEVLKSNLILATDSTGKNLYLVKDKKSKFPHFSERGIIG